MLKKLSIAISLLPISLLAATATEKNIQNLENKYDAKLGTYVLDKTDRYSFKHNQNDFFPICSVFKFLLVGAILQKDMQTPGFLNKKILIGKQDVKGLGYAPITGKNIDKEISIYELSFAAILSDNPAANILIKQLGGLNKLNKFITSLGDTTTSIKANEPDINHTTPENNDNKTTPKAIAKDMYKLAFGKILDQKHKAIFIKLLKDNYTGVNRITAGLPKGWEIGDKTGTCGEYGATNDVAIIWPKGNDQDPIAMSILYASPDKNAKANEKVIQQSVSILTNTNNG